MDEVRKVEIRIELLEPDNWIAASKDPPPPEGITISGPFSRCMAHDSASVSPEFIVIIISKAVAFVGGVAWWLVEDSIKEQVRDWLKKLYGKIKHARPRIKNQEPKDRSDFLRIIAEQIEIGKSD